MFLVCICIAFQLLSTESAEVFYNNCPLTVTDKTGLVGNSMASRTPSYWYIELSTPGVVSFHSGSGFCWSQAVVGNSTFESFATTINVPTHVKFYEIIAGEDCLAVDFPWICGPETTPTTTSTSTEPVTSSSPTSSSSSQPATEATRETETVMTSVGPTATTTIAPTGSESASNALELIAGVMGALLALIGMYLGYRKVMALRKNEKKALDIRETEMRLKALEFMVKLNPSLAANIAPDLPSHVDPWEYLSKKHGVEYRLMSKEKAYRKLRENLKEDKLAEAGKTEDDSSFTEDDVEFAANRQILKVMKNEIIDYLSRWHSKEGYKKMVGHGAFGEVYKIRISEVNFAIKTCSSEELSDKIFNAFWISSHVEPDSRCVMPYVLDWRRDLYVMDYVEATYKPMSQINLEDHEWTQLCEELDSICNYLERMGIVHTDLHIDNIFVHPINLSVKIVDWDQAISLQALKQIGMDEIVVHIRFHSYHGDGSDFDRRSCALSVLECLFTSRKEPSVDLPTLLKHLSKSAKRIVESLEDLGWGKKTLPHLINELELYFKSR